MSLVSVPYSFTPNTTIQSGQVNANNSALVNFINEYCAILNNPNLFSAGVTIETPAGLTVGSSANLTPLNVNGTTSLTGTLTASGLITANGGFTGEWVELPSGTRMLFQQATVPPGWTQDTTVQNDSLLRMVNGAGGGVYTGAGYSTVMHGNATSDGTAISVAQLPAYNLPVSDPGHTHTMTGNYEASSGPDPLTAWRTNSDNGSRNSYPTNLGVGQPTGISVSSGGSNQAHTHTLSALNVNSIDIIVGVKN